MALVKGCFSKLLKVFEDECSPTRHFFARLKLCKHKGRYIELKRYFYAHCDPGEWKGMLLYNEGGGPSSKTSESERPKMEESHGQGTR